MNTEEKSLALAELMKWDIDENGRVANVATFRPYIDPYNDNMEGLAQFAAILLKFPEVMLRFTHDSVSDLECMQGDYDWDNMPIQETILDEILHMKGKIK